VTAASANFHDHIDPSLFYFKAELKPGFALPDVERAIEDELNRLKSEPVAEAELQKARRQIEADLVMSHEEPLQQAMLLGQYETIASAERIPEEARGYRYLDSLIARIRAVNAEEIQLVARQYFTADNRTVGYLVDPQKEQASAAA
jgi:zinc protease